MYPVTLANSRQRPSAACEPHIAISIAVAVSSKTQYKIEMTCVDMLTQNAIKDGKPSAKDITSCTTVAVA
jgi:hypothetical protein